MDQPLSFPGQTKLVSLRRLKMTGLGVSASDFAAVGRSILGTDINCKAIGLPGE
ncbi:MAG: hypothetical protein JOY96_11880 [Verrucomicrobia bacterium]|nr:hypothetical protein [Verrucomicrobiota bacterium]MBV9671423.1 hypothetical protein [Verrucomicrobiota bacterium]